MLARTHLFQEEHPDKADKKPVSSFLNSPLVQQYSLRLAYKDLRSKMDGFNSKPDKKICAITTAEKHPLSD